MARKNGRAKEPDTGLATGYWDAAVQNSELVQGSGDASIPRTARLLKHSDFERVYKQGRRHFSRHFTLFYLARQSESLSAGPRVGFTVGKVLGGAVVRNRIKRRLREAVQLQRAALRMAADVVMNPKKSVLTLEFPVLVEEVGQAFETVAKKMGHS